ncbi:MAG: hypothetical protein ACD_51C00302G0008 [uncultured bacterium]|nr:MAG: hypothetical protein ACD_51C00302G0008 [uncultured bacterium]OGJ46988.1 MAG: hypothetical protein A2244_04585 [Candidatus Peregrinibacteria bacterium RIFOXYA2_FULL_41_18]OGJ49406.1 MAG: hypothetical protein A2344_03200 [Candidatus Peregrinibacteria bacterium RIFOXYB12_FULL_41_12]OGJ53242.1 MAG: hypothetical protein A2336_02710 [Candidatus Peregrinibacteria bacterium RIFOXYB2_FULL_41_88]OGJ53637.1 MAG: hypothetical protein A2448_01745 [Candidatus Peregrinibacteria bacterium RIFOXYC2_FULL
MDNKKIVEMLLKHDSDIEWLKENVATKKDLERIYETLDKVVEIGARNSQELTVMSRIIERLDKKVEEHDVVIKQMKPMLGIV